MSAMIRIDGFKALGLSAFAAALAAASVFVSANVSNAQPPWILADKNSTVTLNPSQQDTMYDWHVEGIDQLKELSNWYRLNGTSAESSLHNLLSVVTPPIASDTNGDTVDDTLTVTYDHVQFTVVIAYDVLGGLPGSGYSSMGERIWITNNTSNSLRFHLFEYFDLDLTDTPGDDTIVPLSPSTLTQYDGTTTVTGGVIDADHYEDTFVPTSINKLLDNVASNLTDVTPIGVPAGPGNVSAAIQWNFIGTAPPRPLIPPHETVFINKRFECQMSFTVPEPGSAILMFLGVAAALTRRSFRQRATRQ